MTPEKVDFKRELRGLYHARATPALVEVPPLSFLMVAGSGDPNTSLAYREAVEALYSVSFAIKFALRQSEGIDYGVMPLEGLWSAEGAAEFDSVAKQGWKWTAMIMAPPPVNVAVLADAVERARLKRTLPAAELIRLKQLEEGRCAQVMHIGPYAAEGPTIAKLHAFILASGCVPAGKHHEIYLGDPRRAAPERLRTIIRQPVSALSPQ